MTTDPPCARLVIERTLTQAAFDAFARLSGDDNPIHVDANFAADMRFGRTVAHGMLLVTILRGMLDRLTPGARLLSQELVFPAPAHVNERLRFITAIAARAGDRLYMVMRSERAADGIVTCDGRAVLQPLAPPPPPPRQRV